MPFDPTILDNARNVATKIIVYNHDDSVRKTIKGYFFGQDRGDYFFLTLSGKIYILDADQVESLVQKGRNPKNGKPLSRVNWDELESGTGPGLCPYGMGAYVIGYAGPGAKIEIKFSKRLLDKDSVVSQYIRT